VDISPNDYQYLLFIVPGFVLVATYRYFVRSEKSSQFELAAFSFVWGMALFVIFTYFYNNGSDEKGLLASFEGVFTAAVASSVLFALPIGFFGAWFVHREVFKFIKQKLFNSIENGSAIILVFFVAYIYFLIVALF